MKMLRAIWPFGSFVLEHKKCMLAEAKNNFKLQIFSDHRLTSIAVQFDGLEESWFEYLNSFF